MPLRPAGLDGVIVQANPILLTDPKGLRARACCRLVPFIGSLTAARHCYIERDVDGTRTTWGLIGDTGGPLSTSGSIYVNNGFDTGGVCSDWNEDCEVDKCVESASNSYSNPSVYRFVRGPNSNTFAGTIARACELSKPCGFTPGWYDPPAQQKPGTIFTQPQGVIP